MTITKPKKNEKEKTHAWHHARTSREPMKSNPKRNRKTKKTKEMNARNGMSEQERGIKKKSE